MSGTVFWGDNLYYLKLITSNSIDMIYVDPPFNTKKNQSRLHLKTDKDNNGDRIGFGGKIYKTLQISKSSYIDIHDEYLDFLYLRIKEMHRTLSREGTFYLHLGIDEVHYAKILCDEIFGRENFRNEIIWAYDYGARSDKNWYKKHDIILMYSKSDDYYFNLDECDRIEYMSPKSVGKEKSDLGKFPTNVFWISIEGTNSKYRENSYSTMKPYKLIERLVKVSSKPNQLVLDAFAGSGMTGEVCLENNRSFLLMDNNYEAIEVMKQRFLGKDVIVP